MVRSILAAALAAIAFFPLAAEERVWTDTQGRTMRAEFLREVDGDAVFLKDGKLVSVPLERFSQADREEMKRLAAGQTADANTRPEDPFKPVAPTPPPGPPGFAPPLAKSKTAIVNREWTDTAGNRTTGRFIRVVGRDVLLVRGVRTVAVSFDKLSAADQAYVNQILEERGQEPLGPLEETSSEESPLAGNPLAGNPLDGQPLAPASEAAGRSASASPSDEGAPLVPGESQLFHKLREREEAARRQQAEFAETNPDGTEATQASTPDASEANAGVTYAPPPPKPREMAPQTTIKAESLAELKPVLVVGVVVFGVFGVVGLIVYIATTLAAGDSARRGRPYL